MPEEAPSPLESIERVADRSVVLFRQLRAAGESEEEAVRSVAVIIFGSVLLDKYGTDDAAT